MGNNTEIDLQEVIYWDVNCTGLAGDGDKWQFLLNTLMNLRVP
jgi:hypothetical protein